MMSIFKKLKRNILNIKALGKIMSEEEKKEEDQKTTTTEVELDFKSLSREEKAKYIEEVYPEFNKKLMEVYGKPPETKFSDFLLSIPNRQKEYFLTEVLWLTLLKKI